MQTTMSIKVSARFARLYRDFCKARGLQIGKFTEEAIREVIEDVYFGQKAQRVLSLSRGKTVSHGAFRRQ